MSACKSIKNTVCGIGVLKTGILQRNFFLKNLLKNLYQKLIKQWFKIKSY